MPIHLTISTEQRVKDLIPELLEIDHFLFSHELDSVNTGEKVEFRIKNVPVRIYDDVRSNLVMNDSEFKKGTITWEGAFSKHLKFSPEKVDIKVEIDRYNEYPDSAQREIAQMILTQLKISNRAVTQQRQ